MLHLWYHFYWTRYILTHRTTIYGFIYTIYGFSNCFYHIISNMTQFNFGTLFLMFVYYLLIKQIETRDWHIDCIREFHSIISLNLVIFNLTYLWSFVRFNLWMVITNFVEHTIFHKMFLADFSLLTMPSVYISYCSKIPLLNRLNTGRSALRSMGFRFLFIF